MTRIEKVLAKKIAKAGVNGKGELLTAYGKLRKVTNVKWEKVGDYCYKIVAVDYKTL